MLERLPERIVVDRSAFVVESAGALCTAADRRAVAEFFGPRVSVETGSSQALARTLEKIGLCVVARKAAQGPAMSSFLERQP